MRKNEPQKDLKEGREFQEEETACAKPQRKDRVVLGFSQGAVNRRVNEYKVERMITIYSIIANNY